MSTAEVAWRAASELRDLVDRGRLGMGWRPRFQVAEAQGSPEAFRPRLAEMPLGEWLSAEEGTPEAPWRSLLVERAGRAAAHRLSFFNLEDLDLGDPIDWNRDHAAAKPTPLGFAPGIDYRDYRVAGDAKRVWEPNRHQHLVVLGRAYRATGDARFARAVAGQLESWLEQCPFGRGMNWRSPLELAVRLINWAWARDLISDAGVLDRRLVQRWTESAALHLWEISRKYSRGSSANNHLIGEAAGVFIGASCFRELEASEGWRRESREILCREILRQSFPDGGGREQALGYQLFVLQFLLLAGLVARRAGGDMPAAYWERLERMLEFLAVLAEAGPPPFFGDADEGYVLDLGQGPRDPRGLLAVGAVLFGRPDFKARAGGPTETARWLLGAGSRCAFEELAGTPGPQPLLSKALTASGYYLLQCGHAGSPEAISLFFDCAALGLEPLAAHGHADALSVTLRAFGREVLVDPGTYDYFTYPAWRDYFRSTRAHNTLEIDGLDQSEMMGPFMWGARAGARCLEWGPRPGGGRVVGEHDGYGRLADPVVHRRSLELDGGSRTILIEDEVVAQGEHEARLRFHFAEDCRVRALAGNAYEVLVGDVGLLRLELDAALEVVVLEGSEHPIAGWVSRGYHHKRATATLVGRLCRRGPFRMLSRLVVGLPRGRPGPVEPVAPAWGGP